MPYMLPSLLDKNQAKNGISRDDRDPLFEDAARMLIGLQQASVSIIQRRLKVGYARAGKIIDELEDAGVVGAYAGSKAREVIMDSESELEAIL
jgi:S-DNA-T family DNA segregation ATPase FtsK/SpoIIIE